MNKVIDINADMGEGFGRYTIADDERLLDIVTSANVACGFHAGDPRIMGLTVEKALKNHVGIGAHPGFPDLIGFGRRDMSLTPLEIKTDVLYQIGALSAFVKASGGHLQHVSPHGRLGNLAVKNREYAQAIVEAVLSFDSSLIIITEPGELAVEAEKRGLKTAVQLFADRAYNDDRTLVSRKEPGAVIHNQETVLQRCLKMVLEGTVETVSGSEIEVDGNTLCVHGDTAGSVDLAKEIKATLIEAGVEVRKLEEWL
ncbi:LamB/YcsF family protein [Alteribacillus sp. YIM 98480]|uniref:LamB/YcsF family protein n=1 Tax=Alteribacillus sp. YIM 98480 TaxID=2606599 RepID=UPI00131B5EB2|nr:5-oxoprolinase subunit PxpA [Alteribacillus sp. YIM 98480]